MKNPRISFGIIVLNGEPFVKYCLRSLYPFAYEIIIVEGGHEDAKSVCTPDGHSIDGTLNSLWEFKEEEDPENKVRIITRNGFWEKRDELGRDRTYQSRAYAEIASGDYLWQVDIDEFYCDEDMERIISFLRDDPAITVVSFKMLNFYARPEYAINGWKFMDDLEVFRIFKWKKGYKYLTHEPPTIIDENGIDLLHKKWIKGKVLAKKYGIFMYHYPQIFPWQVWQKIRVYELEKPQHSSEIIRWSKDSFFSLNRPYSVERHYLRPSWLYRYNNRYPVQVKKMMMDISSGKVNQEMRGIDDIERILNSPLYSIGKKFYEILYFGDRIIIFIKRILLLIFRDQKW